jgi:hypothetical protein
MRNIMKIPGHLLLEIALAGAVACSGAADGPTGPAGGTEPPDTPQTPSVTGSYTLRSVNGSSLPALLWHDDTAANMDAEMYILSGSIVLRADGTFRSTSVSQLVIEGDGAHPGTDMVQTSINDGTYTVAPEPGSLDGGMLITFRGENGGVDNLPCDPVGRTLLQHAMIPGAPGQPDIDVAYLYAR